MLELKRISVGYAGRYQIPNVDLTFEPGKLYVLLGRNGSGKSGILKLCAGVEIPAAGSAELNGKSLDSYLTQELERSIGYLPQDRKVVTCTARRLVGKNLPGKRGFGTEKMLERKRKVYGCLTELRAAGLGHLPMSRLSRGERLRVHLAALLARDPDIFLLDEPFSDLDTEYRQLVIGLLQDLRARGKTVVVAMQDPEWAMEFADEVVLIDLGREVHTGTPEQIRQKDLLKSVFRTSVLRQTR